MMKNYLGVVGLLFLVACANTPKNTVGAPYDADSVYCRDLAKAPHSRNKDNSEFTNETLYEKYCEPISSWRIRDEEGYQKTKKHEKEFFPWLLDEVSDN